MVNEPDRLEPGLSPHATVTAFEAACNTDTHRLFITESWFAPFRERLLKALPPNLDESLVNALRDALYKRRSLEAVVEFIEQQPMQWKEYEQWRHLKEARLGFFPWAEVEAAEKDGVLQRTHQFEAPVLVNTTHETELDIRARARNCPGCGLPASKLTWVFFATPDSTWRQRCGRAGWLVICKPCHLQVDFFLEWMN